MFGQFYLFILFDVRLPVLNGLLCTGVHSYCSKETDGEEQKEDEQEETKPKELEPEE